MMTGYAHAGIKITNESLWYVLPSAAIFMACMGVTNMLKPQHVEFHEIKPSNSPGSAVIMRWITMIPALAFAGFLIWGIYGAYS